MAVSCSSNDEPTFVAGQPVMVDFAYSFSSSANPSTTRLATEVVQPNNASTFRLPQMLRMFTMMGTDPSESEFELDNPVEKSNPTARFYYSNYCYINTGVDRCLVYGKPVDMSNNVEVDTKVYNGAINESFPDIIATAEDIQNINFSLVPIYNNVGINNDNKLVIPADASTLARYLTDVANTTGWSASENVQRRRRINMAMLTVKNLSISFGGLKAVDDFSVTIEKGQLYGLIGPNGAGKTTIFNLLTGVYKPDSGKIVLDDTDITGKSTIDINRAGIARTFQNIRLFKELSVLDNVKAGLHNHYPYSTFSGILRLPSYRKQEKAMDEKAMEILKVFDLDGEFDYKASNLPYGKQRKLEIARAIATEPKLLLLDEPAAGMNPNETAELMDTIRFVRDHFDMTILLIEHDMKLVSGICERLTVLNFGHVLAEGPTAEVLNNHDVIVAYLGE